MIDGKTIVISLLLALFFCGCRSVDTTAIRHQELVEAPKVFKIPSYKNIPPIEIIYDSNPELSDVLESYLEEYSATLVIAANYDKIKDNRFIKMEVLADTIQVLRSDLLEHTLVVAITPSPICDDAGNIYSCSPRYFRITTETPAEIEQDYDNLIQKLLSNNEFFDTLKSIVQN